MLIGLAFALCAHAVLVRPGTGTSTPGVGSWWRWAVWRSAGRSHSSSTARRPTARTRARSRTGGQTSASGASGGGPGEALHARCRRRGVAAYTQKPGLPEADDLPHSNATTSPFPTAAPRAFRHDAVFYVGERGFLPGVMPFVSAALERDEPVLVALVPAREDALRSNLGDASRRVEFVDMESAGRNPARIIPVWRDFVTRHAGERQDTQRRRRAHLDRADRARDRRVPAARIAPQPGLRRRGRICAHLPLRPGGPAGRRPRGGSRKPPARRRGRQALRQHDLPRHGGHRRGRREAAEPSAWHPPRAPVQRDRRYERSARDRAVGERRGTRRVQGRRPRARGARGRGQQHPARRGTRSAAAVERG